MRMQFGAQQPDYYAILGVKPEASPDEIKAAYKKLALEFHPDRNSSPGAEEKFKQMSEAYSVVGNKTKRKDYDAARAYGNPGFASSQGQGRPYPGGFKSGFGPQYTNDPFGGGRPQYQTMSKEEADRLFRELFGGIQIDQIFRDFERQSFSRGTSARNMAEFGRGQGTFRPFFREESTRVFTDEFGNRTEERVFTTKDGTRFTVNNTSSKQEGASVNQTADDFYRASASQKDGRVQFGTSSFQYRKPSYDFGKNVFGVNAYGRHPAVSLLIITAWSIVVFTVLFGILNFAVTHPLFLLALFFLFTARRMRF